MKYIVNPSKLSGTIWIPPSKSHTMRAVLFASLAHGKSIIHHYLPSPDTEAMIHACRLLGAQIEITKDTLNIIGTNGRPKVPDNIIDAGNSGQVLRFIAAIAAATISEYVVITGDESIRYKRPLQPLISALNQLGGFAVSTKGDGFAPIIIKGLISAGTAELEGQDSQPVSAMLMGAAFLAGETQIKVINPGEKPWIDLTLSWFDRLGIQYSCKDYEHYMLKGHAHYEGFEYSVPGDFSSAAFPLVAALITGSEISLANIDMNDVQGDKAIIPALQDMGAELDYDAASRLLHVKKSSTLKGGEINVNNFIDAVPILAVAGCFCENGLQITGAEIAKHKESDRLEDVTVELRKMKGDITSLADGLTINNSVLSSNTVLSHHDHRMAMSLAVAGLAAAGTTHVEDTKCVAKSFPGFAEAMKNLGADIQEVL
jgi:3-phosphoshikimate 1-carboxyvinyltransferase